MAASVPPIEQDTATGARLPAKPSRRVEHVWLESYPAGVAADVDVDEYRSLGDIFEKSVARFGEKMAYVNMGGAISYREIERLSRHFSAYLQAELKLERGARVALMMPNILQYPVALFGVLRAGCTVVTCNPLYTARELEYLLQDSGAEAIVVVENFAAVVAEVAARTKLKQVVTTQLGDMLGFPRGPLINFAVKFLKRMVPSWRIAGAISFKAALRRGAMLEWPPATLTPDDLAFVQYTGGTTGIPKGAMLTHRNMMANLQQAHAWLKPFLEEGRETIITALPLYHIFALTANLLTFFKIGATNVLITNPRDIPGFVKELAKRPFTVITGVNTLFNTLLADPNFAKLDFSRLKFCLGGGMAMQRTVAEKWKRTTGKPVIEAYGLTEAAPAVTINPLDLADFNGSIGLPVPSTEVAIRGDEGGDLPFGEVGELCVRGPQVMRGYWRRPAETAKVMTPDGFLRTGDLAVMDEKGFVRIVDRKKDLIVVSGFKVFPNEVEEVVAMCPGVLEVAAFGVPDENSGEAVKISVVKRDPGLTLDELIAHCRKNLTGYKIPRHVEFRTQLPKTPVGKILRRALREGSPPTDQRSGEQAMPAP